MILSNSERKLFLDHCLHTVVHILYEGDFWKTKTALIWDVVNMIIRLRVLTMDASNLHMELVCDRLELLLLGT